MYGALGIMGIRGGLAARVGMVSTDATGRFGYTNTDRPFQGKLGCTSFCRSCRVHACVCLSSQEGWVVSSCWLWTWSQRTGCSEQPALHWLWLLSYWVQFPEKPACPPPPVTTNTKRNTFYKSSSCLFSSCTKQSAEFSCLICKKKNKKMCCPTAKYEKRL